ncbi:protein tlpB [Flavobacterium sp. J49]|uniref:MauE/DoxX family redox-associated membrane protein n=1 Tax=Flavobacterium sp. J49 TaxID=2718534 RepID=UPI001593B83A|nr:MauE/DoxX family redox-associated membrane protein [Flavobacterium sp. J49]MBF6640123.1 protein tlpB [Flavobacterium sp. J49]NIC01368.1 protein tlpB [Flavobacterium sp. J49]
MAISKNNIAWGIRIVISFLFLLSAVAKLYPSPYFAISTFEVKQLYPMGFSESFAPYFSRVLIGIELALGFLILQKHFLRSIIIPATILLLFVFTSHLTIETIQNGGNSGNCGCFGSLLPMTPIEAILKNVAAMALLIWLLFIMPKSNEKKDNFWLLTTVTLASILALFMLAPIQPIESSFSVTTPEETTNDTIPETKVDTLKTVVTKDTVKKVDETLKEVVKTEPTEPARHKSGYAQYFPNIDKGRKTLCFFVPGCDHCRDAAKELTELRKTTKNFPEISIIFMNEEADLIPAFFKYAGAEYPYKIIEVIPFWKVLGSGKDTPGIKYLWNGNEYKYYWGITDNKFVLSDFESLINKPYSELKK